MVSQLRVISPSLFAVASIAQAGLSNAKDATPESNFRASGSFFEKPLDLSEAKTWAAVPALTINNEDALQNLFRRTIYNARLPNVDFDTWQSKTSFAHAHDDDQFYLGRTPGTWHFYREAGWLAFPIISVQSSDGVLIDYLNVDPRDGSIRPFGVLDVWKRSGKFWGLVSTGVMKSELLQHPRGEKNPYLGRDTPWPEESRFPDVRAVFPVKVEMPRDIGRAFPLDPFGSSRLSDNWKILLPAALIAKARYSPEPCRLEPQSFVTGLHSSPAPAVRRTATFSGLFKVEMGGDLGRRWVLVYTNVERFLREPGRAEYFGLDAGPATGENAPDSRKAEFGRIFYGQEVFSKSDKFGDAHTKQQNWSAATWNVLKRRMPNVGGRLKNCPGSKGSVDVDLATVEKGLMHNHDR